MAGANIAGILEAGRVKEAWDHLVGWYRKVRGRQAHPTREGLVQVSADRAEIYIYWTSEGLRVPLLVQPAAVNDDIPAEAEIEMLMQGLKSGRAGVPSGMCTDDLKGWLREAKCKKDPERRSWELAVILVQVTFRDGTVPEEVYWATMVLLQKGKGGYLGIGRVEVL